MTTTPTVSETPSAPTRRRGYKPGWKAVVGGVVAVGLAVAVVLGVRWWRSPDVFYPVDSTVSEGTSLHVGQTAAFGISYVKNGVDTSSPVKVASARPNVLANTANATIKVVVCTFKTVGSDRVGAVGVVDGPELVRECTRLVSPDGATMNLSEIPDQLVVTITPRRPGVVLVKGLRVAYSYRWQRGPQDLGQFVRLRAR